MSGKAHRNITIRKAHPWGVPPWTVDFRPAPCALPDHVDFAIIGGGFTGLSAAAWLRRFAPGRSVLVLESASLGEGASGRTGGMALAETAAGKNSVFEARQIPSVAYTDPEVAWAGLTEDQCKAQGLKYGKAVFPWAASGRAIANGRDEGFTKLLFDESNHRVLGGGIVGTHAGDLIGEVCLAVEMGCDPVDIGKTIHPHPTLCESIGMCAKVFEGICTDLPPLKKK